MATKPADRCSKSGLTAYQANFLGGLIVASRGKQRPNGVVRSLVQRGLVLPDRVTITPEGQAALLVCTWFSPDLRKLLGTNRARTENS